MSSCTISTGKPPRCRCGAIAWTGGLCPVCDDERGSMRLVAGLALVVGVLAAAGIIAVAANWIAGGGHG